jgi:YegS/Rv2252/BmrU family lipid kinase
MQIQQGFYVIINPASGCGKSEKKWPLVQSLLNSKKVSFEFKFTEPANRGDVLAVSAIEKGYRKIISVGGDGNLQDVLNGIMTQKVCSSTDVCVGVISLGTGNDWIKTMNLPTKLEAAIDVILFGKQFLQDVGICEYTLNGERKLRYFHNFAGVGFDSYLLERTVSLKKLGTVAYLLGMLKCLISYEKPLLKIHVNEKEIIANTYLVLAGIGQYGGGGMKLTPGAKMDDGKFFLSVAKNFTKLEVILNIAKLYDGSFIHMKKVETLECSTLKIDAPADTKIEADGEVLGNSPFVISMLPKAFKVMIPK